MGWADVDALKRSIPADQFDQWCRYYQRYPFDSESDQIQMAMLLSMIANMFRDRKKTPLTAQDFLPFRPLKPPPSKSLGDRFRALFSRFKSNNAET